jgi:hypothetical protein
MKLTITDKVFVPVSNHKESTHWLVDTIEKNGDSYFTKEETNKYVISREELEKVISDAFEAGVNREYQERNYERRDYNAPIKEQYINLIL